MIALNLSDLPARLTAMEHPQIVGTLSHQLSWSHICELLELSKDEIMVVKDWTILLPRDELEAKLRQIVRDAQERLAHRDIASSSSDFGDDNHG